jgi:hypothetical protein
MAEALFNALGQGDDEISEESVGSYRIRIASESNQDGTGKGSSIRSAEIVIKSYARVNI